MKAILTTTDLQKGRIWAEEALESGDICCVNQMSVYPNLRRQTFQGFGGAFTEAAATSWQKLPEDQRQAFLECYFGKDGLQYTVGRTHINSCDFSLGNYACVSDPQDEDLASFQADRDEASILPMILAAQEVAGQPIGLLLSPWSPPAFMKTNGEMNNGGKLLPEYRDRWAACMAKYAAYYRNRGCDVRLMSIQNEPAATQTWDSCRYTAQEEGEFAANHLRPALDKAGLSDVNILAWDHNKDIFLYRAQDTLSVPGAKNAVSGFALHWYTGDHFEALGLARETWPDKAMWFTEGCVEYSRFDGMNPQQKAEMYAHDIMGNLNGGVTGSIDWNLLLDSKGGPNHVGNFCEAPIMLKDDEKSFQIMSEYYYIGQFSRFIRPGAVCLGSSLWCAQAEATAFENVDGSRVVVALNRTDAELPLSVTQDGAEGWSFTLAPHTIATLRWE